MTFSKKICVYPFQKHCKIVYETLRLPQKNTSDVKYKSSIYRNSTEVFNHGAETLNISSAKFLSWICKLIKLVIIY